MIKILSQNFRLNCLEFRSLLKEVWNDITVKLSDDVCSYINYVLANKLNRNSMQWASSIAVRALAYFAEDHGSGPT